MNQFNVLSKERIIRVYTPETFSDEDDEGRLRQASEIKDWLQHLGIDVTQVEILMKKEDPVPPDIEMVLEVALDRGVPIVDHSPEGSEVGRVLARLREEM